MTVVRNRYDSELHMFVHPPREPDMARLRFLRWLGEQGRLEHELAGRAVGELVFAEPPELPPAA